MKPRKAVATRIKLPGGELLTITVRPEYIHLKRTAPGQRYFIHEVYIPRSKFLPILRWLVRAVRVVPRRSDHYPPLAMRDQLRLEEAVTRDRKAASRALDEARHRAAKQRRYRAARRRAKRRARSIRDDERD